MNGVMNGDAGRETSRARQSICRRCQNRARLNALALGHEFQAVLNRWVLAAHSQGGDMLTLLFATAAVASNLAPNVVGGLEGCWTARGHVRGRDATSIARGDWHLGKRYFILHLRSVPPAQPYEAAITYGAGEKPGQIGSFWMDTFGGLYEPSLGLGVTSVNGFALDYRFPDVSYHNQFVREKKGWHWAIVEQASGRPDKPFAEYDLKRTSCAHLRFRF